MPVPLARACPKSDLLRVRLLFGIVAVPSLHRVLLFFRTEAHMADTKLPQGYHTVTPYLIIDGAAAAIDYYRKAFGAVEVMRFEHNGKVGHAEINIGDSRIMLSDPWPEWGSNSPTTIGGTPVSLMIYVPDVDTVFERAIAAGGKVRMPVQDQFYGDRSGNLVDPFGHVWTIATHKQDVPADEITRRFKEMMAGAGSH
jgi:PhnB protein